MRDFWDNFNMDFKKPFEAKLLGGKTEGGSSLHDGRSLLDRYIFVKTLTQFYEDCPDGIILDTAYADSQPNADWAPGTPVVLGLHDTPGSHSDLLPVLSTFAKLGCRAVAPSFPGHGDTQGLMAAHDSVFSHSSTERAMFVQDFLGNLGIERVDLVIGVGAASYTVMRLVSSLIEEDFYKSFALISPWPLSRPRYDPDCRTSHFLQELWDRPVIRTPVSMALPAVTLGPARTVKEKVNTAFLINNLDLSEAGGSAMALGTTNIPRAVIYGGMDQLVGPSDYTDLLEELCIPAAHVAQFKGKQLGPPQLPSALEFPDGGYDLDPHSGVISLYLLHLLTLLHPQIKI